jgi:biotin carboxyl carrier protein
MEEQSNFKEIVLDDTKYLTLYSKKFLKRKHYQPEDPTKLRAFIPGVIQKIYVVEGQEVKRGQPLVVLEAMKMKNDVFSPVNAIVKAINVKVGDVVSKGQVLLEFQLL